MSSSSSSSLLATWRAHGARPFARKSSSYDSSDDEFDQEEEENISILLAYRAVKRPKFGGSVFGRQKLWRERIEGHEKLMRSYFNENPIFPESYFRRRFRMSLNLFKHIATEVTKYDRFFEQRRNAAGELGHSTYQKVTAALRMLAYGIPADLIDDHLAMGESTSILCVKRFVVAIVNVFGSTYLRAPNAQDTARLLEINANRGFPGMLGSIDCMHWSWKNCPAAWHGQFKGYKKDATIVLEAVADQETWIWHAFFGMPGSCNDINVLQRSPLMTRLAMREGPLVEFEANGHKYNYGYFLADGIYPRWQTFVKPIIQPRGSDGGLLAARRFSAESATPSAGGLLRRPRRFAASTPFSSLDNTFFAAFGLASLPPVAARFFRRRCDPHWGYGGSYGESGAAAVVRVPSKSMVSTATASIAMALSGAGLF
ncbi:hypothetical protein QYE76_049240 [Lolium multiflorum]|uniref:Uncharacterized protein n=1 Tax=Lolium multiflorum TaxID=4521 RepID=A0AAD8SMR0_LOLMU|nr:hypothetical protein QYE76_049240 [Lolium multiflorum]